MGILSSLLTEIGRPPTVWMLIWLKSFSIAGCPFANQNELLAAAVMVLGIKWEICKIEMISDTLYNVPFMKWIATGRAGRRTSERYQGLIYLLCGSHSEWEQQMIIIILIWLLLSSNESIAAVLGRWRRREEETHQKKRLGGKLTGKFVFFLFEFNLLTFLILPASLSPASISGLPQGEEKVINQ